MIIPNLFTNEIQTMIYAPEPGENVFELFGLSGRTVAMDRRFVPSNSTETIRLETSDLEPGCYVLKLRSENHQYIRPLLESRLNIKPMNNKE